MFKICSQFVHLEGRVKTGKDVTSCKQLQLLIHVCVIPWLCFKLNIVDCNDIFKVDSLNISGILFLKFVNFAKREKNTV